MSEPLIENIYYMLSYAYRALTQEAYKNIAVEAFDNVYDLFAAILSKGILSQVKRGLYREYREESMPLSSLRGKIALQDSLKLITRRANRLHCVYDELTENIYMNRLLKTTALLLARRKSTELKPENARALNAGLKYFDAVDCLTPSMIDWKGFVFHRNNYTYQMLVGICYLVLKGLLLTKQEGDSRLAGFIDDQQLSRLYEKFILAYLQKHYPELNPVSKEIPWDTPDGDAFLPAMRSDVFLTSGAKALIIDAKFFRRVLLEHYGKKILRSENLYQIYVYVKNEDKHHSGSVSGMLLYAKTDDREIDALDYVIGGSRISVRTLDLNQRFCIIKRRLDGLVADWREAGNVAD